MIIKSDQMKAIKLFWEKCLEENWPNIYLMMKLFSNEKTSSRKWTPESEK